ncbi:hypothetical protein V494_05493 [Pseudogymnoascus sp. VKM F-4513 (FW-928)]|nr:hypothetical protein V494_05493 [Pseudogymnoascus sp. VKM F-4513 (FW-928)]
MLLVGVLQQPPQQPTATLFTASRDNNSSSEDKQIAEDTGRSYSALFSGDFPYPVAVLRQCFGPSAESGYSQDQGVTCCGRAIHQAAKSQRKRA